MNPEPPKHTPGYRIEWNATINKFQIKIPGFNVAVAEFYDNTASSRNDIEAMLNACANIQDPAAALATVRDALVDLIQDYKEHVEGHTAYEDFDRWTAVIAARAALALLPAPTKEGL